MARTAWRKEFDPEKTFTVRRKVTVGGKRLSPGDSFDPTLVTVRRLRQLYDQRIIQFEGDTPGKLIREFRSLPPSKRRSDRIIIDDPYSQAPVEPTPEELAEQERLEARSVIDIPDDWATLSWNARRALAKSLTDDTVKNGDAAAEVINAEIARRAGTP